MLLRLGRRWLPQLAFVLTTVAGCAASRGATQGSEAPAVADASLLRPAPPGWRWHEQADAHIELLVPEGLEPTVQWFGDPAVAMQLDAETPELLIRVELYPIEGIPDPAAKTDWSAVVERIFESFEGELVGSAGVEREGIYGVAATLGPHQGSGEDRIGHVLAFPVGGFEYRVWLWGEPTAVVRARPVLDGFRFRDSIDELVMANVPQGRAYWLLGDYANRRDDNVLAERYYMAALSDEQLTYADRETIGTRLADLFTNTGRIEEAIGLVTTMKDAGIWSDELRRLEGWLRTSNAEFAEAVPLYRGLLVDGRDEDWVVTGLALALVGEARASGSSPSPDALTEAEAALQDALRAAWPSANLHLVHAVVAFAREDLAGALRSIEQAVAWMGMRADRTLALHLHMAGIDLPTFGRALTTALPERDESPDALRVRALLTTYTGDGPALGTALEHLTVIAPHDAFAWFDLGSVRRSQGDHRGALEALERAWTLRPNDPVFANQFAWHLATAPDDAVRDGARASRIADTLLAIDRLPAWQLDTVAAARAEAGDFEAAVAIQTVAIERERRRGASDEVVSGYERHLAAYRERRPWREDPRTPEP